MARIKITISIIGIIRILDKCTCMIRQYCNAKTKKQQHTTHNKMNSNGTTTTHSATFIK